MGLDYPPAFLDLTRELRRLPGIGPRSAERVALWLLGNKDARPGKLAEALTVASATVHPCSKCGFFATDDLCEICQHADRQGLQICVVEHATDILPIERTGAFHGLYHSLGGRLAPLDHVGPENLRVPELMARIPIENPTEIILALSADVEGEATTNFLVSMIAPLGVPMTRIAHGLPAGGGLEHADQMTVQRALSGRRPT